MCVCVYDTENVHVYSSLCVCLCVICGQTDCVVVFSLLRAMSDPDLNYSHDLIMCIDILVQSGVCVCDGLRCRVKKV